jgi:hypothetical protein
MPAAAMVGPSAAASISDCAPEASAPYRRTTPMNSSTSWPLRTHQGAQMKIIDLKEARKTQRRPFLDMGLIRFGDMSICCVVRNLSEAGAALDIGLQLGISSHCSS